MSKLEEKLKIACGKYECVKKEKCENDNFISSENYRCTLRNGKVIERNKIIKNGGNGDASIIVPLTDNNEVILTIQPRVFTDDTVEVSFPGGMVDKDEDNVMDAAKRELLEETGVEAKSIEKLGSIYVNSANSSGKHYYFLARGCKIVKEQDLDDDEFIDIVIVPVEEVLEYMKKDRTFPSTLFIGMNYLKGIL